MAGPLTNRNAIVKDASTMMKAASRDGGGAVDAGDPVSCVSRGKTAEASSARMKNRKPPFTT
jgi:hypothetical protein